MLELLNTLYVTTPGAYVRLDHETVRVEADGAKLLQVPVLHLRGIVCFGNVMVSPAVMQRFAQDRRSVVFLDDRGRFAARVQGPTAGNVLLRWEQYEAARSLARSAAIARAIVGGKIQNARFLLQRAARETPDSAESKTLRDCVADLAGILERLKAASEINVIRGLEGEAARRYFGSWDLMIKRDRQAFALQGRQRRPPTNPMNALLSFLYTLLTGECIAAAEGVGLDPQIGYLHELRPGRPALALDLVEELRPSVADRLAIALINLRQATSDDFVTRPGGAIHLSDAGRKKVIVAYERRKQEQVYHPVLDRKVPIGLIPHVQARLLARHLRGDLDHYVPWLYR
ncbi:type I-C CRISPR-associated endonuclease Cas1c [Caldinitratiruptor microaerophilus]|uniref:CRISPR-associated endonuclease Cas1 n=1 Tax=Caldinitratiruptor microaerophilus TaxID=671077 RepID=A0AA35CIX3_9FIRM|nr:type I-C CRISPR-associated endonuclease Cas1c [Caldinitratiruptor microaerophilus]BDG59304.1 CRISPR-associated endonuclease Cas1 1 [Caldinitratiruptor microaerophilus]